MKHNQILIIILIGLITLGTGFFGGIKYQERQSVKTVGFSRFGNFVNQGERGSTNQRVGMNRGLGGSAISGEVISVTDSSVTVKLSDGSSKIIILAGSTTINKTEAGSKTDLAQGTKVVIFGSTNSDGSVTAQNIQIGGMFMQKALPTGVQK